MIRRAFLYWAHLDKRRPVLVVSPDWRNDPASDVIIVPCSTRLRFATTHVVLKKGEGGVPAPSVLHCEQVTTIRKGEIAAQPLGRALAPQRMIEVERAILRAIGVVV
jgi:mRNA-degrading endonuclease toxin of MazEF toxin-antitoxin module